MKPPRTTLVIAAHPDDEALGCGGTITRWASEGANVHLAFLADGVGARGEVHYTEQGALNDRRDAANRAAEIMGAASVHFDDLPDNRLDSVPLLDITQRVEALIERYQPDTVLTHHAGDLNIDHRRVYQAVMTACRPQPGHPVQTILSFEVPSSTEWQVSGGGEAFVPNWFEDITETLPQKLKALEAYATEMREWPHTRSIEAVEHLARWRGATVGVEAAEAFILARQLNRRV
jgi:LmbE family N-acetylglucosaminyl deacetylase